MALQILARAGRRPGGRGWRYCSLAVGAALLLSGCAGAAQQGAGEKKSGPLVIGASLPLSGDFSQPGGEARRGYEIWRDMVNAKGGLLGRQVQLKIMDDASSQDTVVAD